MRIRVFREYEFMWFRVRKTNLFIGLEFVILGIVIVFNTMKGGIYKK